MAERSEGFRRGNSFTSITVHIAVNGSSVLYEYLPHSAVITVGVVVVVLTIVINIRRNWIEKEKNIVCKWRNKILKQ